MTTLAPQPIIQAQLDAYNRHDAEAFATAYAPEAEILELATGTVLARGTAAIRTFYATRFQANPHLHAEVLHRVLQNPGRSHLKSKGPKDEAGVVVGHDEAAS
jgi:hypothetical protein